MRMTKWVSMIMAGMLFAAAPAFADGAGSGSGSGSASAKTTDTAKTGDTTSTTKKTTSKKKGHKKVDKDVGTDTDKPKGDDGDKDDKAPAADSDTTLKAGTSISKREIVGEADTFTAGTKVWVWSAVMGQSGKNVKMVWKKGDSEVFTKDFDVTSGRFRTWTRHTVSAGSWTVEIQDADGKALGSVAFTVS